MAEPLVVTRRGLCDGCGRIRPNPATTSRLDPLARHQGFMRRFTPLPLPSAAVRGLCPICFHRADEPDRW